MEHTNPAIAQKKSNLSAEYVESLVVAILAVSRFPQERVRAALPALRAAGMLVPESASKMDLGELTVILARSGYDRGRLTSMYAERLMALMNAIQCGVLDDVPSHVAHRDRETFEEKLETIFGIGPSVAANAWKLLAGRI